MKIGVDVGEQTIVNRDLHQVIARRSASEASTARRLRLAYLTTEYPKPSHTFIRREILALERRGHTILRISIRSAGELVDPADVAEAKKTVHCLAIPKLSMLLSVLRVMLFRPLRCCRAMRGALNMSSASDRGIIRHLAYLVEAATLLRILDAQQVQHVHVHFGTNAAAVARLIRILGGPSYSMTIHGPDEFDGPISFSIGPKVVESAFTVAISDYAAAQLRRWVDYEHWNKLHVVRCTIDDSFLSGFHALTEDSRKIVCIGRLTAQKGQILLIEALDALANDGCPVHLVLAGDGEMRHVLEQQIGERGLEKHVTITGWIGEAEIRRHLREARVMVLASFAEGLPVAIMEAMALGRPVISTRITGIPELVRDGENGWLITAGRVDEIVSAVREAMETPLNRLNDMARAGHELVRRQHHVDTEANRLEGLFQRYCASK